MKHTPRTIIFIAVSRYLTEDDIKKIIFDLTSENVKQDRKFLSVIRRYFDFEKFKDAPYIWQDIWLYNYLLYDHKTKLRRDGLIAKYEREIVIPSEKVYKEFIRLFNE
jgi:hypothetical protein